MRDSPVHPHWNKSHHSAEASVVTPRTASLSCFVISLDFELFWGVADAIAVAAYRKNVEGEWEAIPRMLAMFQRYGIHATWATVGMLMCRDHKQWRQIRPTVFPGYLRRQCSTYSHGETAREHPRLFFARPLVERILATPGQELATHTYSHFYCGEEGATPEQFAADLACARAIAAELGVRMSSLVFPRNQMQDTFVQILPSAGIHVYRGTPDHWLYRAGHFTPAGMVGRAIRFADAWAPLSGDHPAEVGMSAHGVANVPASIFLRPWTRRLSKMEPLRLTRLKRTMTTAARTGRICHLWWHPHNFGVNIEQNLAVLETLLKHFLVLQERYGMRSLTMAEAANLLDSRTT